MQFQQINGLTEQNEVKDVFRSRREKRKRYASVEPISKGGGKSFVGRIRRPPGRKSPVVDVRIGVYGKGTGKWSLREAKKEWSAIRTWSRENGKDPRERKREQQALLVQKTTSPTLEQACESFLSDWTSANEREKREYRNLLLNQVLPEFDAKTPVEHFSWEYRHPGGKTTRELMTKYLGRVRKKAPAAICRKVAFLPESGGAIEVWGDGLQTRSFL